MRLALALVLICLASPVAARVWQPADDAALTAALAEAGAGDEIKLEARRWRGPLEIHMPLILQGTQGAVVDGQGAGSVILVDAPDVQIRNLQITGSGSDLDRMDAGVFLTKAALRAQVVDNDLTDNLHGVRIQGARDAGWAGNPNWAMASASGTPPARWSKATGSARAATASLSMSRRRTFSATTTFTTPALPSIT
jgi:nitrous oxidase accessory protein